jgi:hypothetical protein
MFKAGCQHFHAQNCSNDTLVKAVNVHVQWNWISALWKLFKIKIVINIITGNVFCNLIIIWFVMHYIHCLKPKSYNIFCEQSCVFVRDLNSWSLYYLHPCLSHAHPSNFKHPRDNL